MLKAMSTFHSKSNETYIKMNKIFNKPNILFETKIQNPPLQKIIIKSKLSSKAFGNNSTKGNNN